jgi:electron transfer flavoprotein beta subunit
LQIVTFTRSTPDTAAKVDVDGSGAVSWGGAATVVNPWDEYALEEAIVQAGKYDGKTLVVAIGPELHNDALKHSIAMGINDALRVEDAGLDPNDSLAYATAAAALVKQLGDVDLVLFGRESIDVGSDQHIYQTARKLGWPMLSGVSKILELDPSGKKIKVEKITEHGKQVLSAALPAVVSVSKEINEPRYPSFIGIRKASKANIEQKSLADLGISAPTKRTEVQGFRGLPVRETQVEMIDGTPEEQAKTLVDRLLAEKVL